MIGLTRREADGLRFISQYVRDNDGVGPAFTEIAAGLGLASKSGVYRIVNALEERGYVRRLPNRARSLEVLAGPAAGQTAEEVAEIIVAKLWARKQAGQPVTRPDLYEIVRGVLR